MKLPCTYRMCPFCGRRFRPDRYNAHHQECCPAPDCQAERKRKRDRERYRRNYHAPDKSFCEAEKARRSAARRRNPGPAVTAGLPPSAGPPPVPSLARQVQRLSWTITGLVRAFSGESDPVFIHELASSYEASGQRLGGGRDPE